MHINNATLKEVILLHSTDTLQGAICNYFS